MNYAELKKIQTVMNRATTSVVCEIMMSMTDREKKTIPTLSFSEKEMDFIKNTSAALKMFDWNGEETTFYEVAGSFVRAVPKEEAKIITV